MDGQPIKKMTLAELCEKQRLPFEGQDIPNDCLYLMALEKWGLERQRIKFVEECGEAIQAMSRRQLNQPNNLEEEIADLLIMIDQIILFEDIGDEVYKEKARKIERLKRLLKGE